LVLVAVGCGGTKLVPVSGRVNLDGQPLANANVVFEPDSQEKNPGPGSSAKTDDKGEFSLQSTTGNTKGAVVGKHKVSITAYEGGNGPSSSGSDMKGRKRILEAKSTFEVPAEGTTNANFDFSSKDPPAK
jgi:hypothetical protein